MDIAHPHLVQTTQYLYGSGTEVQTGPYGLPTEAERMPRFLGPNVDLQTSSYSQYPVFSQPDEQSWPSRILDEVRDLLLIVGPDSRVMYASPSCKSITGFDATQLENDLLSRFIHNDDQAVFMRELNECISMARPLRCHFRLHAINGSSLCVIEAHGHPHLTPLTSNSNQQQCCHGVFLICRPYHTHSTQLLDSFLEHKVENIRLKELIAQLKAEEEEELNAPQQAKQNQQLSSSAGVPSRALIPPPPHPPSHSSTQDTSTAPGKQNGSKDEALSDTLNTDNIGFLPFPDQAIPLAPAPGNEPQDLSHIDGIELMTGLLYGAGERSQGISTGAAQGRLVHYTSTSTSTPPPEQKSKRALISTEGERRKRLRGEYTCSDCGTSDSPEWRKGPDGPKTLCNACGLRWAKKEKKRHDARS